MREPLRLNGKLLTVSVKREADRWWVSLSVDTGVTPTPKTGDGIIGVDVGIKSLAVTSDGRFFDNSKPLTQALKYLRFIQKAIARSINVHGLRNHSNRRERLYTELRRTYERIANLRKQSHRQAASAITKEADAVVVESLNIAGMVKNRKLSRALNDVALGSFLQEIAWQCEKRGVRLIEASQWFPSSKTCSGCGAVKSELTLSEREYVCGQCGLVTDRDLNAALNLKRLGQSLLRGESVKPDSSEWVASEKRKAELQYAGVLN